MAIHALFGLVGSAALLAGLFYVGCEAHRESAIASAMLGIDTLRTEVRSDLALDEGKGVLGLLLEARNQRGLEYAAVVDSEGKPLTHTNPSQPQPIGSTTDSPTVRWRGLTGTSSRDTLGQVLHTFSIPLASTKKHSHRLQVAVREPAWNETLALLPSSGLLVLVAPLLCFLVGSFFLFRLFAPLAAIEQQLAATARIMHSASITLTTVEPSGVATVGWNRLVNHFSALTQDGEETSQSLEEAATLQSDTKTDTALQSLTEGVAVTDAEGRIRFANQAIEALLSAEGSLEGEQLESMLEALAPEQTESIQQGARETEVVAELPITSESGKRTLRVARAPLFGASQDEHVWNVRDITQQKLAESARDQFIDTATHELRTPLANIKAYAETLASSDFDDIEMQKEFCNTINTEATRLSRFVDDLLSISSLEVGSLAINRQNVDLKRLLDESIAKIVPLMRSKSIQFNTALAEKLGDAKIDKDKIAGLLLNLLGNAVKYTPDGGEVSLRASVEEGNLVVEIRDTGVGISEEEQGKVFEKFFRSENPEVQDQVGTGLGLSLACEIARLHRGDVSLTSTLGEGSTFTLTLPV